MTAPSYAIAIFFVNGCQSSGAAVLREPQNKRLDRLEGFVPAIADWHARMCLVQVCTCVYLGLVIFNAQVILGRFFSIKHKKEVP